MVLRETSMNPQQISPVTQGASTRRSEVRTIFRIAFRSIRLRSKNVALSERNLHGSIWNRNFLPLLLQLDCDSEHTAIV